VRLVDVGLADEERLLRLLAVLQLDPDVLHVALGSIR
jgi:hypothetical protein